MRTHYCGELRASHVGETVTLTGWVHRRRDHGGVIFLDVRDRGGIVQVVFDPDTEAEFALAERVRGEFVLQLTGRVRQRDASAVNPDMPTGEIEVLGKALEILNAAETPPFQLDEYSDAGEDVRLRYRYLDLRRPEMQQRLMFRSKMISAFRRALEDDGYVEVETPMLTRSTPEGARDFLVPSRVSPGSFFALPQSPQVFKQLLMMSGMDRYYQVARCFRDEDLRANRQPEFTQMDIEASFVSELDIRSMAERILKQLFRELLDVELDDFPVLTYDEAMRDYGCDDPDLRNPLKLVDVGHLLQDVDFKVFKGPASDPDGRVAALRAPGGAALSRKVIDEYTKFVGRYGARGLAYIKVNDLAAGVAGLQSPIVKFLPEDAVMAVLAAAGAQDGDLVFFGAAKADVVNASLGALRDELARDLDLLSDGFAAAWIIEFPMFEQSDGRWTAVHHPFTHPSGAVEELSSSMKADPGAIKARAYDVVINGHEIGGGSIRIHRAEVQQAVFDVLQMGQEAGSKFGFLLDALKYGCPPHGGIAFGLDRLCMIMTGTHAIRDIIAFPKTQSAACAMTGAPAPVDEHQLRDLQIRAREAASDGTQS